MLDISLVYLLIALLVVITIHEAAHAWMANYLGDPTARLMGRLTLNPLAHLDLYGTLVFIVTLIAGFPFGWGKPVPFDPYNLKDPKRDAALISLAGPASNIILASILSLIYRFFPFVLIENIIVVSVSLAIFNLVPIHPLDGGKILTAILPNREARQYDLFLNKYGFFVLLLIIFPIFGGQSLVSTAITPIVNFLLSIFLHGSGMV